MDHLRKSYNPFFKDPKCNKPASSPVTSNLKLPRSPPACHFNLKKQTFDPKMFRQISIIDEDGDEDEDDNVDVNFQSKSTSRVQNQPMSIRLNHTNKQIPNSKLSDRLAEGLKEHQIKPTSNVNDKCKLNPLRETFSHEELDESIEDATIESPFIESFRNEKSQSKKKCSNLFKQHDLESIESGDEVEPLNVKDTEADVEYVNDAFIENNERSNSADDIVYRPIYQSKTILHPTIAQGKSKNDLSTEY